MAHRSCERRPQSSSAWPNFSGRRSQLLSSLAELPIEIDAETADHVWHATVDLAAKHSLTVYDATYLELAMRKRLPLATLDQDLMAAARAEGLTVLP